MDATELQALLTLAFNTICIAYSTLMAANFILGLAKEWMRLRRRNQQLVETAQETLQEVIEILQSPVQTQVIPAGWDVVEPSKATFLEPTDYTIRELKAMVKQRHIPKYGNMTKAQLIQALA